MDFMDELMTRADLLCVHPDPPTIVVFSMNISVSPLIENAVVLDCLSRGNPPPTVTWFKDGKMMDIAALPNGSLYISSVDSVEPGKYLCSVTNSLGTVVSPTVTLEIDSKLW